MNAPDPKTALLQLFAQARNWMRPNYRLFRAARLPELWAVSIVLGIAVAGAAILFRLAIEALQWPWLQVISERVATIAAAQPWWVILIAPACGGIIVGLLLHYFMPGRRAEGVADVIEARHFSSQPLSLKTGLTSATIAAVSLGSGASAGREGPVVHLGATLASSVQQLARLPAKTRPILLACGVAAAVSGSFNAPIAGVLFAHEIILGHYALSAFVPIVLSSVIATVLTRLWFGEFSAFIVPEYQITSYFEVPAFMLLGLVCAVVAIIFQFALVGADYVARNVRIPLMLRPVVGGLMVGAIAIAFPQVLGVGYETTDEALHQRLPLLLMLVLLVAKTAATAITLASRFGGGIFSPSLYLGAMTGGAFGIIAASVFPDMASSAGLYAILGMGAVAAAVLGAPISTTVIVFELTGGYSVTLALLLAVSVSSGLTQAVHGRSFFHWQLESRGLFLQEGAHKRIIRQIRVSGFMRLLGDDEDPGPRDPNSTEPFLTPADTLESALRHFDHAGVSRVEVISEDDATRIVGYAYQVDALRAFSGAMIDANIEEHR